MSSEADNHVAQDNRTQQVERPSMEESIQNTVVVASTEILNNAATDLYTSGTDRIQNLLTTCLTTLATRSPTQQFVVGLGTGWFSGYLFRQVSRTAAFVVGCGFLAAQLGSSLGIITVDWKRMQSLAARNLRRIESTVLPLDSSSQSDSNRITITDRIMFILHTHIYISSGFLSGLTVALTF